MQYLSIISQWVITPVSNDPYPGYTDSGVISPSFPDVTQYFAMLQNMVLWNDVGDYLEIRYHPASTPTSPMYALFGSIKGVSVTQAPATISYAKLSSTKSKLVIAIPASIQVDIEKLTYFSYGFRSETNTYYTLAVEDNQPHFRHVQTVTANAAWLFTDGDVAIGDTGAAVWAPVAVPAISWYGSEWKINLTYGPTIFWTNRRNCVEF